MSELTYERYQSKHKKPGPTAKARAKRRRAESPVAKAVRAACEYRDGYCRVGKDMLGIGTVTETTLVFYPECDGPSEWAHMHSRRRSQTRNQAPEVRHDTAHSFMACRHHHDRYDGRQFPRLFVTSLTSKGADGRLKFRSGK